MEKKLTQAIKTLCYTLTGVLLSAELLSRCLRKMPLYLIGKIFKPYL